MVNWFTRKREESARIDARTLDLPPRLPPLQTIYTPPPSNTPSPTRPSEPPPILPLIHPHPPLSFRPTAPHRPGSSSGFKPVPSRSRPAPPILSNNRRPATSSGVPQPLSSPFISFSASSPSLNPSPPPRRAATPKPSAITHPQARKAARLQGFVLKSGKRHHPRPSENAPYPCNYERKLLDHDVWLNDFARQLASSVTFHVFDKPPARVLDLGCGTASWILDCARDWPDTHFTGLDLVPIQPNPSHLPPGLRNRLTFVLANFLEPLPFPKASFSFVHVRRVARGVPEDKWGPLFEEIERVLEPGGVVEIIEEDLFFPGSVCVGEDDDLEEWGELVSKKSSAREESPESHEPFSLPSPPPTRPRADSLSPTSSDEGDEDEDENDNENENEPYQDEDDYDDDGDSMYSFHIHGDPRDHSLLERAYAGMHAARFINLTPLPVLHGMLVLYFRDVRSHPALLLSFPPRPSPTPSSPFCPNKQHQQNQHLVTFDLDTAASLSLPRHAWHFDIGGLNMHLSARVVEVLACAEEMWGWLCTEGQAKAEHAVEREEWEECLGRFEMDMQDKIGLASALETRLSWRVRSTPRTPERKAFDEAVRRWERHQARKAEGRDNEKKKGVPLSRRFRVFIARKAR